MKNLISVILLFVTVLSCKKLAYPNFARRSFTEKFLRIPENTHPAIRRVAEEIKKRNGSGFLEAFAEKYGTPVWENAILKIPEPTNSIAATSADTMVYIPLKVDEVYKIESFIAARLNSEIYLGLCKAQDYKAYPLQGEVLEMTAEKYAFRR